MRLARTAAVAAAALTVLTMSGCIILAPPLPTRQPQQPPSQTPRPSGEPQIEVRPVEPDAPITTTDETDADTGELYAGSQGETVDGYFPDAALDLVLEPTRGTARVAPGIAMPVHDGGDELLPGTPHTADASLLLTTVGRLVLETEDAEYTCSGTVINSESGLVVVTAAHCVFDDETRDYYDRITFEPGYERGDAPFGTWEAERWWVPDQYLEANDRWLDGADDDGWMGFDFGFVRFAPQGETTLEDVVGGQGVSFTAETNGVVIAGYPGNDAFDAEVLRHCAEDELDYGAGGDANYGADCEMGDGASGSGFVSNLDPQTGAGHITAVYSNGGETGAYGPPLGVTAYNGLRTLDD
ncbi:V8-like Glu-specific endopeptidase [Agrococcus sp. UYP10]|uniref:trypsin-like serine peptidase n=1 Tax=Agrococcus sp. UYP10 TaxID=1756355 RepID=UPI003391B419